jgi:DNA-binding transcriptional MerR regulator
MMVKPEKFYKVSEIMQFMKDQKSPISRQTLHNYTLMGLIQVSKRTLAGHRLYDEDVFERLLRIEALKRHHPLWEVKKLLAKRKQPQ